MCIPFFLIGGVVGGVVDSCTRVAVTFQFVFKFDHKKKKDETRRCLTRCNVAYMCQPASPEGIALTRTVEGEKKEIAKKKKKNRKGKKIMC